MKKGMFLLTALFGGLTVLFLFVPGSVGKTLTISAGTTFYHFAMRLIVGYSVPYLFRNANVQCWWFRQRRWEPRLYRFLKVRKWKRFLPTYDPASFDTKKHTPAELICTMCHSELVHEWIMVFSFLPLLAFSFFGEFWVFFLTSFFSALFDSLFVIVQRYNRPRLEKILRNQYSTDRRG